MTPLEQYIRQAAAARGINPDVAVRVASGEGGLNNPFRHGEGPAPKSQAPGLGTTENSYGPFQLYISGTGSGLGDKALAAGVDPRKNWQGGVDFALDQAKADGWSPWYGAKAAGITGMMGIGGTPVGPSPSSPAGGAMAASGMQPFGSMAPSPQSPPASPMVANAGIPADVAAYATSDEKQSPLQRLGKALQKYPDAPQARSDMPGPAATNGSALLQYLQNPRQLAEMFLKQRLGQG